jgi:hypothetical protein
VVRAAYVIRLLRFNILLALVVFAIIRWADQFQEAARASLEDALEGRVQQLISLVVGILALAVANWYWARAIVYLLCPESMRRGQRKQPALHEVAAEFLPRLAGALPLLGLGIAFGEGLWDPAASSQRALSIGVAITGMSFLALFVAFLVLTTYRSRLFPRPALVNSVGKHQLSELPPWGLRFVRYSLVLWAILLAIFWSSDCLENLLGAPGIVLLAAATWVGPGSLLAYHGSRHRVPWLVFGALLAVLWSGLDLNDDHYVRSAPAPTIAPAPLVGIGQTFRSWLSDRRSTWDSARSRYPVFVIATQGGGIRQAYYTGVLLGYLEDKCPGFSSHVFAISSVSGGSVGASVFDSMLKGGIPKNGSYAGTADATLSRDLLAPLLSQGLYPDLLQRFVPGNWWSIADRARALEHSIENASHAASASDQMARPFMALWDDPSRLDIPYLFLNTTMVETGNRVVITPITPGADETDGFGTLKGLAPELNPPLSTAAALSSRFPIVTPVGSVAVPSLGKRRLADGGYFENSGTATLLDIIESLKDLPDVPEYDLYVIEFRLYERPRDSKTGRSLISNHGLGELLSPVRALMNTRTARGETARKNLARYLRSVLAEQAQAHHLVFEVHEDKVALPLGWMLSAEARREIRRQLGTRLKCDSDRSWFTDTTTSNLRIQNRALISAIRCRVLGEPLAPEAEP